MFITVKIAQSLIEKQSNLESGPIYDPGRYRCGCSFRPGFTLFVHFSWQAILMFWMAAMAAVGREMEGGPIK